VTKRTLTLALALLALAGVASAQIATGNIYGVAKDESGALLPGVAVTLKGDVGTKSTVSGPDGAFRFLSLDRGNYTLTLALSGFATAVRNVRVTTGENLDLTFAMKVSGVAETVEVTGESPLVDTKKRGTATTMTSEELNEVPSARDPWGVMKAVPGVLVDRVNIAGNENGQQASYSAKGSMSADGVWNIDGVTVTDMSSMSSTSYYDYGAFQEINMTTGGTDMTMQTGGLGINLVTKRGTNTFHGSARYLLAHNDLSFGNIKDQNQAPYNPAQLAIDPRLANPDGSFRDQGDNIRQIGEYGFDLGGPIFKDKLWFYGTYGKQDIRLQRLSGTPDKTLLPSYNAKLNWQATGKTMVSAFYFLGNKQKYGRSPGSGLLEENGVLFDQANQDTKGGLPAGFWKLQVDQTFTPNLFMSAKVGYYDAGFGFTTRGDTSSNGTHDYLNGVYKGTGTGYLAIRPETVGSIDGSYFFPGLGGTNELKFGFGYRKYSTESGSTFYGPQIEGYINTDGSYVAKLWRDSDFNYSGKYYSAYIGDMLSLSRFTINVGVRWDGQSSKNDKSSALANKSYPDLMPAGVYTGSANIYDWNTFSPRLGVSYAFNEGRTTVARASYARYYEQLNFSLATFVNPVNAYSYLAYGWNDTNGDGFVQKDEVDLNNLLYYYAIDPANPGNVASSTNKVDKNIKPKYDDEFIVGIDHEVIPGFAVGAAFTYRIAGNWRANYRLAANCGTADLVDLSNCPLIQGNQYVKNAPKTVTVDGKSYTAFTYSAPSDLVDAGNSGLMATNRPQYKTHYQGLEVNLNKRLANKWMARVAFTYADWTRHYPGAPVADGHAVPLYGNPSWTGGGGGGTTAESFIEGDQVASVAGGSGKSNFYTSFKWQVYANALYQFPWGIDLSGAMWGRQGGLATRIMRVSAGADGTQNALASPNIDTYRYGSVWDFDLRLSKTFKLGKQPYLTLAADWFNISNNGAVLVRNRQVDSSAFNRIDEVLSPSIFRVSAQLGF
jgi:carboxypeptidase family protein